MDQIDGFFHQLFRARSEGQIHPAGGAEQIGDNGKVASLDPGEEKGRAFLRNHPAVDFRQFQMGIDGRVDFHQVVFCAQLIEKGSQMGVHGVSLLLVGLIRLPL